MPRWPVFIILLLAPRLDAHPFVQHALDIIIAPDSITLEARISDEQIAVVETGSEKSAPTPDQIARHAAYVVKHLQVTVDGAGPLQPGNVDRIADTGSLRGYRLIFPLRARPDAVRVRHSFFAGIENWDATCQVRVRQSDQKDWESALLTRTGTIEYGCDWSGLPIARRTSIWTTSLSYLGHGIQHILSGYDHLLFVTALLLAARTLWDLVKVVTAFTLAHSITLALAVFDLVKLSPHVVEPMIAASIVFVALQNIIAPRQSTGYMRLAIAFGFGLFHGLGFAGGLRDAMEGLSPTALWAALIAFALGVEIGHQIVILPAFTILHAARNWGADQPRHQVSLVAQRFGSCAITIAGLYYLIGALH